MLSMSIKKYFEITAFPLTNVLQLNRNLLPLAISHGSGFWQDFMDFGVYLQKQRGETLHNKCGMAGINTSID